MDRKTREKVKKILSEATNILKESLQLENIISHLKAQKALKPWDVDDINKQMSDSAKVDKLIGLLRLKPVSTYNTFVQILKTEQLDVYQKIKAVEDKYNHNPGKKIY